MSQNTENLTEKALANEQVTAAEPIEDTVLAEKLQEDILALENEIENVADKLKFAKSKGLIPQANRCRDLLQMLIAEKQKKLVELEEVNLRIREAETKRFVDEFSKEIDALADHVENDVLKLSEELPKPPEPQPMFDHIAKSKRLSLVARVIAAVGILSGLIGAFLYMLMVEYAFFPFTWLDLAIFGGIAVVLLIVALCVGAASNKHSRIAQEIEEELKVQQAEYEAEMARIMEEKNAIWKNECVDSVLEAYRLETEETEEQEEDTEIDEKKTPKRFIPDLTDPKVVRKVAPIAAVCTAAVAAIALGVAAKKSSQKRKAAKNRNHFFYWSN